MSKKKRPIVVVFFDEKKAEEYEKRAAEWEAAGWEVEFRYEEKVSAGSDGKAENGEKTDR